ncbi:hypothetical protein BDV96DRAFT_598257 [Lophiotrema nucula]|uniref:DNA2/NAM7 helicase-like C-terminal domain-containing protein n=1 Tax=Lophiotrema nucula TaxID=690887 RepID=A0A6A5ZE58_9PLEO|nr:hypothetical protein BDV96DRAFT_598257 [Lophiotrema nucula]
MIITFYAADRTAIKASLAEDHLLHTGIRLRIVDSCQSQQGKIVIVHQVRASKGETPHGFVGIPERQNLALSRAEVGQFMVGNIRTWEASSRIAGYSNRNRHMARILEYIRDGRMPVVNLAQPSCYITVPYHASAGLNSYGPFLEKPKLAGLVRNLYLEPFDSRELGGENVLSSEDAQLFSEHIKASNLAQEDEATWVDHVNSSGLPHPFRGDDLFADANRCDEAICALLLVNTPEATHISLGKGIGWTPFWHGPRENQALEYWDVAFATSSVEMQRSSIPFHSITNVLIDDQGLDFAHLDPLFKMPSLTRLHAAVGRLIKTCKLLRRFSYSYCQYGNRFDRSFGADDVDFRPIGEALSRSASTLKKLALWHTKSRVAPNFQIFPMAAIVSFTALKSLRVDACVIYDPSIPADAQPMLSAVAPPSVQNGAYGRHPLRCLLRQWRTAVGPHGQHRRRYARTSGSGTGREMARPRRVARG